MLNSLTIYLFNNLSSHSMIHHCLFINDTLLASTGLCMRIYFFYVYRSIHWLSIYTLIHPSIYVIHTNLLFILNYHLNFAFIYIFIYLSFHSYIYLCIYVSFSSECSEQLQLLYVGVINKLKHTRQWKIQT